MNKIVDYDDLIPVSIMINAVETDDQVGALLRFHLLIERLLIVFLESKIAEKKLDKIPRLFGHKIEQSKKLGLPQEICEAIRCINDMRNSIAHILNGKFTDRLDENLLQDLKNKVNRLEWVRKLGGLSIIKLRLPLKYGEKIIYINDGEVTDLVILASSLLSEMSRFIKLSQRFDYTTLK